MGRMYTAQFTGVTVAAAQDFFGIKSPTSGYAILHGFVFGQTSLEGDANEENLAWYIKSGATTIGSGGSDPAAVPILLGDAAATAVPAANDTTEASVGTIVTHMTDVFNNRVGIQYWPPPELRFHFGELVAGTATYFEIGLLTVPTSMADCHGTVWWEEVG